LLSLIHNVDQKGSNISQNRIEYCSDSAFPIDHQQSSGVRRFVRSPFEVRCNVVKVWRPLPLDLWTGLTDFQDRENAARAEHRALIGVLLMASLLIIVLSGISYQTNFDPTMINYPLIGKSSDTLTSETLTIGWHYTWPSFNGHSIALAFWVVAPSLAGWAFFRVICVPIATTGSSSRQAVLTFLRHLSAVYLYVYVMIMVGVALMIPFIILAPAKSEWFRWCFWCFLFGESFFVPAAMWTRLVIHDRQGQVFSRYRLMWLTLYLSIIVVIPICGMIQELD